MRTAVLVLTLAWGLCLTWLVMALYAAQHGWQVTLMFDTRGEGPAELVLISAIVVLTPMAIYRLARRR